MWVFFKAATAYYVDNVIKTKDLFLITSLQDLMWKLEQDLKFKWVNSIILYLL